MVPEVDLWPPHVHVRVHIYVPHTSVYAHTHAPMHNTYVDGCGLICIFFIERKENVGLTAPLWTLKLSLLAGLPICVAWPKEDFPKCQTSVNINTNLA